jgi:hypothetical protein
MHTQGQGNKEIHHQEHGRVGCYPYVPSTRGDFLSYSVGLELETANMRFRLLIRHVQVISQKPPFTANIPSQKCTSSSSTASHAPSTARSSVSDPARAAATAHLHHVSDTTRTARRSTPSKQPRPQLVRQFKCMGMNMKRKTSSELFQSIFGV